MKNDVIDISPSLRSDMPVYPGNPDYSIRKVRDVAAGAHSTLSEVTMGTHTGTHVDAPAHFIAGASLLEQMPLSALVGEARVIALDVLERIEPGDLEPHRIGRGERVLIKTSNSALWRTPVFVPDYVYLSTEAAEYLADKRPACVGVDYLSVGGFQSNGTAVHAVLLEAGVLLVEGLDLTRAEPGVYDFVCLPLKLAGAEAAPARAILRRLDAV